jgi:hypothetical protein
MVKFSNHHGACLLLLAGRGIQPFKKLLGSDQRNWLKTTFLEDFKMLVNRKLAE